MWKSQFNLLLAAFAIIVFGGVSSFSQQPTLTKKRSLVLEFRRLTGAQNVNLSVNFSTEDIRDTFSAIVEKDSELTDAQKQELRKSVAEAYAPVEKLAKDFFADRSQITQLSEEVIYKIYDSTFNEAELGELIAFYLTPTGQKAALFLPTLSSQVQKGFVEVIGQKLQNLVQPIIQAETEKLKQKVRDTKAKKPLN